MRVKAKKNISGDTALLVPNRLYLVGEYGSIFAYTRYPNRPFRALHAALSHLAVAGKVSASIQNQAKSALLFLYKELLVLSLPWLADVVSAKLPQRLPVVHAHRSR